MERRDFLKKTVGIGAISFAAANLINTSRAWLSSQQIRDGLVVIMEFGGWVIILAPYTLSTTQCTFL